MMRRIVQFLLVLLLVVAVGLVSALTTMHFAIHGAEVKVPDFRGMSEAEARKKAASEGLDFSIEDHFYSAVVPESRIVTQSPLPGTVVRTGWQVRASQSLGAQRVAIPEVIHQPERAAALALRRVNLQIGTVARLPYAAVPPGQVIAQSPDAGSAAVDRPSVSLLLSAPVPAESSGFVMPDFTNQPVRTANVAVTQAGMKLLMPLYRAAAIPSVAPIAEPGEAPAPPALPIPPGTILSQQPVAGSRIEAGAAVQFTVAQ